MGVENERDVERDGLRKSGCVRVCACVHGWYVEARED